MGSELIHYEALRKQMILDRRTSMNIKKKLHVPPYQPYYVTYELPKDDMYVPREQCLRAEPTVHCFTQLNSNQASKYLSLKDIHGNSSASYRRDATQPYSARLPNRFNNSNYLSQW